VAISALGIAQQRVTRATAFVQHQRERASQAGFQTVDTDLAVALNSVAVAGREIGAGNENRQEQSSSFGQLLVVEIAAMSAWFPG
jgi:hypothetical protein